MSYTGPFECGTWPDLSIFRFKLKRMLSPAEKVVADKGYRGECRVMTSLQARTVEHHELMNTARARHETVNGRLKAWSILKDVFRHPLDKHHIAFRSVIVIEQIEIENGHPPFQVLNMSDRLV